MNCKKDWLFILACSATKRKDVEIKRLLKGVSLTPSLPLEMFGDYRQCTEAAYRQFVQNSRPYPACLRYNGVFYRQINPYLWQRAGQIGVLILSAYYGFLRPTDGILDYNLAISQVKPSCKRLLVAGLKRYMAKFQFKEAIFLTSSSYFSPFKSTPFAKRLCFYDSNGKTIMGPYGRDYYTLAGQWFANLLSGNVPELDLKGNISKTKLVVS